MGRGRWLYHSLSSRVGLNPTSWRKVSLPHVVPLDVTLNMRSDPHFRLRPGSRPKLHDDKKPDGGQRERFQRGDDAEAAADSRHTGA
ncbi:hypothetical protein AGR4A_Lc40023 [Agrobacterium tumefaciens str. B6]|uniref:Uncharacterized protein n=1 Tax=Agrobacterium tumefaciens str. B6 TaxID=1183423 RepID=A0A822V895_AGRTU|nr:hypothetical protein AGR4A_Lc40023 [Agrobacterium tumefaciens str. B6]